MNSGRSGAFFSARASHSARAPVLAHRPERVRRCEGLDGGRAELRARAQLFDAFHKDVRRAAISRAPSSSLQAIDLAQAKADAELVVCPFDGRVPVAQVHIGGEDGDAMFARVADDLRGRVEPHGLGIEERRAEDRGMVAFHPAGDIDQMREAGGMAFREAIFAESFDLTEAARGEFRIITALHHAPDHLFLMFRHHAARSERRHCLTQLVGFGRRELRRDHGNLHCLLLKDGNAQCANQNVLQFVWQAVFGRGFGIKWFLQTLSPFQIRVHHVALDRSGADDGDLYDEVVEFARFQARQHVHLRAAFDLENAEGVAPAQHVVNGPVILRHGGQRPLLAAMRLQQIESLADAGQHPERQNVDLHDAERLDIVLVPFDETAVRHRAIADGDGPGQRFAGQNETANMLRQVARHADQLVGQPDDTLQVRVGKIETRLHRPCPRRPPTPSCPRRSWQARW